MNTSVKPAGNWPDFTFKAKINIQNIERLCYTIDDRQKCLIK